MRFNKNFKFEKRKLYSIESGLVCYFGKFKENKHGVYIFDIFEIDDADECGGLKATGTEIEFLAEDLAGAMIY